MLALFLGPTQLSIITVQEIGRGPRIIHVSDVHRMELKRTWLYVGDCQVCHTCSYAILVPRHFNRRGKYKSGTMNNSTLVKIHGCIPTIGIDVGNNT